MACLSLFEPIIFTVNNIIQIAGIRNADEANLLLDGGVDYIGFPLRLAYHQPDLTESAAAEIITQLHCSRQSVLITYLTDARKIAELSCFLGVKIVQLHGAIAPAEVKRLRKIAPELAIIKSLIVKGDNLPELQKSVDKFHSLVNAFITDTFDPATGACGATGKTHDWEISRQLVEYAAKPVILAGGLNPSNVRAAILTVQPDGVDAHTGVENADGRKDKLLLQKFVSEARQAFALLDNPESEQQTIPIDGVLDLHTFSPKEVKDLIPEYLLACREKGIFQVRIIHGKGTGALRETVHALLQKSPLVVKFQLADETGGGWGATIVWLKGE